MSACTPSAESYYLRDEPFLGVFVTTASFAETASECVEASGIVLVPGTHLAQFLAFHRVGIVEDEGSYRLMKTSSPFGLSLNEIV